MTDEAPEAIDDPRVDALMAFAQNTYEGQGPKGATVVVDVSGAVVEVSPGSETLPATVAVDLVAACNEAFARASNAASAHLLADSSLDPELRKMLVDAEPMPDGLPKQSLRAESDGGAVFATVDGNSLQLVALYLEDLSEEALAAVPQAVNRARDQARASGEEVPAVTDQLDAVMGRLNDTLAEAAEQMAIIENTIAAAERDLAVQFPDTPESPRGA